MDLSIVTTMYNSAPYLEEFYSRALASAKEITEDFEIILVNDGSPDNSLDLAISLHKKDEKVKIIDLSRNFGHHKAIMTGLAHAKGDLVFLIDCDLEEEPELLPRFYEEFKRFDADVVYGVQEKRKGKLFERITGGLFYNLINKISSYPVPANVITARLMSQRYVASLVEHRDQEIFLVGLWAITGFKQIPLIANKHDTGNSTYSLRRKISNLVNAITSSSNRPLVYVFYLGSVISGISILAALYFIVRRIFFGVYLAGWPSLIVSIWLLGGITIFCLGLIGIYLSKIFTETKRRPYTIIRDIYERQGKDEHDHQ
jgi:putative glycosyltransferase